MALFIIALIFMVIAFFVIAASFTPLPRYTSYDYHVNKTVVHKLNGVFLAAGSGVMLIGVLMLVGSMVAVVGTKNVGVLTTFGRPSGYIDNGFHWKAPWQSVTELSDAIQTDTYASDNGTTQQQGAVGTCVNVRIARQSTACVNVSIRWQIKPSGVDYLFRNFKDNTAIQDNLVLRDLQTAMNASFETYDPIGFDANGLSTNEPLSRISTDVQNALQAEIGQWVDVLAINIPIMNFPASVQDKINQLQSQITATKVAEQAIQTNEEQARANDVLSASLAKNPLVLIDKCLNIQQLMVEKGMVPPAASSCFGGSSASVAVK